jgi:hypothetical protein
MTWGGGSFRVVVEVSTGRVAKEKHVKAMAANAALTKDGS